MAKSLRKPRTLGILILLVLTTLLAITAVTSTATAEERAFSTSATSGIFTGTDSAGDFQAALNDAVAQAVTAAGCCDILVDYEVLETTGSVGGLLGLDDIRVKIYAKW